MKISGGSAPISTYFVKIAVGNGIACGLYDGEGMPVQTCSNFNQCTNAVDGVAVCWTPSNQVPVTPNVMGQLGFNYQYTGGSINLSAPGNGQVCIKEATYSNISNPVGQFNGNYNVCGVALNSNNYLQ